MTAMPVAGRYSPKRIEVGNCQNNQYVAIFLCTLIRQEKYRYNYGRKWHAEKMRESVIRLPSRNGAPDWDYMERFVKGLSYSANL